MEEKQRIQKTRMDFDKRERVIDIFMIVSYLAASAIAGILLIKEMGPG